MFNAAVVTVSDKGFAGERIDTSGPAIINLLENHGWIIAHSNMIPDDFDLIKNELITCADILDVSIVLTTGGTGFSIRDITPEATIAVVERLVPGIPEVMRAESVKITPRGMLSRAVAGIRANTLIVNLPGSKYAASECLSAIIPVLNHAVVMLRGSPAQADLLHK